MASYINEQRRLSWDDLKVVLAVAKSGSLTQAAVHLKSSHPTVFRRIQAIELALGVKLFERSRSGYLITDAASDLVELAERVDADLARIELKVAGRDELPSGLVSLTTAPTFMHTLLPPVLAQMREALPSIRLELSSSDTLFNLNRREADIALRSGGQPPDNLVGKTLCAMEVCLYQPAHWPNVQLASLHEHPWVMPDDSYAQMASLNWLVAQDLVKQAVIRCNSMVNVATLANAGMGLAALPCYLGDISPGLRRIGSPMKEFRSDLWLLWHPQMRRVKRIRAVVDFLSTAIIAQSDLFEGRRPYNIVQTSFT